MQLLQGDLAKDRLCCMPGSAQEFHPRGKPAVNLPLWRGHPKLPIHLRGGPQDRCPHSSHRHSSFRSLSGQIRSCSAAGASHPCTTLRDRALKPLIHGQLLPPLFSGTCREPSRDDRPAEKAVRVDAAPGFESALHIEAVPTGALEATNQPRTDSLETRKFLWLGHCNFVKEQ